MRKVSLLILALLVIFCTPASSKVDWKHLGDQITNIGKQAATTISQFQLQNLLNITQNLQPTPARCWVCTLMMSALIRHTAIQNVNIDDFFMNAFCGMFPSEVQPICNQFIATFGGSIISSIAESKSPDEACRAINLCNMPQCTLFQPGQLPQVSLSSNWEQYTQTNNSQQQQPTKADQIGDALTNIVQILGNVHDNNFDATSSPSFTSELSGWYKNLDFNGQSPKDWFKGLVTQLASNHTPPIDGDGDHFSSASAELRGYHWRGRDCNDDDAQIYPGRKTNPYPGNNQDFSCNGISGTDPATGQAYKDLLCANTNQLGVVVLGDSAGAHAEPPRQWVDGTMWNNYTFSTLLQTVADEIDLPHMSAYTGYAETGITGPVSSVYKYLYERNKCNFRDYQNVAVNGVSSRNAMNTITRFARDPENDHPLLIFLELVGNDVCNHEASFDAMTGPEEFRQNILNILDYLDANVPAGSHLVTLGVVNGSLVFDGVSGRMHPTGVSYNQLYDFENCLGANMCWGWLNTDQSIRDATTQRAMELNQVYRDIFSTYQAKNFDFAYYDFPVADIWQDYMSAGGDPYDLIEPVDGFHPSQLLHAKLGDWLWTTLMTEHADWFGEVNPNNDKITELFGDQGGYEAY